MGIAVTSSHHISSGLIDSTMVTTLPCQLWAKRALGCEHWTVYVWLTAKCVAYCTCVGDGHVTARFLSAVALWKRLTGCGEARPKRRGLWPMLHYLSCNGATVGGEVWRTLGGTNPLPSLAARQCRQVVNSGGGVLRGGEATGPYLVWWSCAGCSGRIYESTYSQCLRWQG